MNKVWAGDITYIATNLGWVYLAVVLDLKNKEAIGYEISKNIDSELSMSALGNAIALRGKHKNLIFHSDRGSQYSSNRYQAMLAQNKIMGSMRSPLYKLAYLLQAVIDKSGEAPAAEAAAE